ncbi:GC-rich sequence DNA-binding factor 2 [Trichosurus vulpecula]|uniref:GC-rich sequence DNA-binding factor 2 n=1 Tax=Trichosurus vulpecula TaxID=9337 RepID=UPI00186ADB63|nr:GC-rich sequence DNA-binding factor 2 [Trichosurus vulpecula]
MSQRPPRNFRQRQANSSSNSDPDSDPGPNPDSGRGGRVSERTLGAPRSRGRGRVWATSRRAGTSQSGPAPPSVHGATSESCSSSPEVNGDSSGRLANPTQARVVRRRLRQGAKAQEDYLPLSERPHDRILDLKGSSDTDSEDRPAPGGAGICTLRLHGAGEVASSSEGGEEGSSEGEAQDVWEAQQMRKALRDTDSTPAPGLSNVQKRHMVKRPLDWPVSFPPVNLESIKKQLSSRLASLEGVYRSHQREYERCLQDMDSAKNTIANLEKAPDPTPTHAFYRGLKAYLAALVDCLSEKIVVIQQLEAAMHSLLQERAASSLQQRQAELQKEAAHLQRLAARKKDDAPEPSGLQEDVSAQKLLAETTAPHSTQRRQARESCGRSQHQEGMSNDGEDDDDSMSPSEGADFQERRGAILRSCHSVFEDVSEEFSDVQKILLKFQQWRERFPDSYHEAYASLCLPKLFSPFIRIQMLDWNPLKPDCTSLQHMPWFQSLEGFASSGAAAQREEDSPDREILPAALDKTVLPHITGFVRFLWDPVSTSQTRSLVQHCREILGLCAATRGRKGQATQELMDSVISRLKKAVEEDVFIPLYPKRVVEDKDSPHSRFQERQFWSATKLLGNILLWDGLVLEDTLRELALDKLLNRYLVIGLSNACPGPGVAEKYRRVVESLPESWLSGQHAGSSIPQLASLTQALVRAAQQLHDSELSSEVGDMVLLLVKMKALTQAQAFVERNQLDLLRSRVNASQ